MSARTAKTVTSGRQKLLLVVFGLTVSVGALVLAELGLALLGWGDSARHDDPFVGFAPGVPLFTPARDPGGRAIWSTSPGKLAFFEPQQFAAEKPADGFRVFAVGGSTTAGRPYDHRVAFPGWLERFLETADPSRSWEVVNAGAISYASYRVALVMQELVRFQPDLFVIYTGHNEFLEERSYSDIIHQPPWRRELAFRLGRSRLATVARSRLDRLNKAIPPSLSAEVETRLEGWSGLARYRRDDDLRATIVEHFGFNLRRMIGLARDAGARVLLVAPVSNLADFSPFKSEHGPGLDSAQRAQVAALLAEARQQLANGQTDRARTTLDQAITADPLYAETHFRLGQALTALGRYPEARAAFERAQNLDVAPLRATSGIMAQVRAVAARENVDLIDLPAMLAAESRARFGHDLIGDAFLLDHVHPDIPIHSLLANEILTRMEAAGWVRPTERWTEEARQAIEQQVVASLDREDYARRDFALARVLGWAGKLAEAEAPLLRAAETLPDDPEIQLALGILYEKTGRDRAAAETLALAATDLPDNPEVLFNLGVVSGRQGDLDGGIEALRRATTLEPTFAEAHHNLGVLLRRRGDLDASVTSLETARDLAPTIGAVWRNLGIAQRRLDRVREAVAAIERAIELDPEDVEAHTELGITHAREGAISEAERALGHALAIDPDHAEAHFNLARVYAQTGRANDASAAYRQAIRSNPLHARALNNLGILLAGNELASRLAIEETTTLLERAVAAAPDYADAHFNLGLVHDRLGAHADADARFARALELAPSNPRFHFAIGMLKLARGEIADARARLRRAHDLGAEIPAEVLRQLALNTES